MFYKKDCVSSQLFIWQSSFCIRLPFPRISWWIVLPSQGYKTLSLPLIYLHALRLPTARLYKWKQETASTYLKQRRFQSQAIFSKSFFWNLQSKTFRTRFSQHSAFHKMNTQLAAEAHLRDYVILVTSSFSYRLRFISKIDLPKQVVNIFNLMVFILGNTRPLRSHLCLVILISIWSMTLSPRLKFFLHDQW